MTIMCPGHGFNLRRNANWERRQGRLQNIGLGWHRWLSATCAVVELRRPRCIIGSEFEYPLVAENPHSSVPSSFLSLYCPFAMMESRKRPHTDDDDVSQVKKRVFTGVNGSPEVNGVRADSAEPSDNDQLEVGKNSRCDGMWVVMLSWF